MYNSVQNDDELSPILHGYGDGGGDDDDDDDDGGYGVSLRFHLGRDIRMHA